MSTLNKLYHLFSRRDKLRILALFFMMLIAAALEVAGIGMIPAFVSIVADPERVMQYEPAQWVFTAMGIETSRQLLVWGAIALIGIYILKNVYLIVFQYIKGRFLMNRRYHFSSQLMTTYMQAPYTFHLQRNTSELLRNTTQEVNLLITQVLTPILQSLMDIVLILSILVFLFIMEPVITLFVMVILGGSSGLFLYITQKRMKRYGKEEQVLRKDFIKAVNQGLGGIKDARILNRENYFIDKFKKAARRSADLLIIKRVITHIPKNIIEIIAVSGIMLIALLMVWQGRPVSAIIPTLSLFAMATVRLMPAISQVTRALTQLRYSIVSVHPLYDDMHGLKAYRRAFNADRKSTKTNRITLEHTLNAHDLHYNYPGTEEKALRGVDFDVPRGHAVAFTGPSGAGKTTIADLVLGLLDPVKGTISVDGKDIRENLSAWQQNVGYIPQFIYLADETLRSNIAFGIPDDEVSEAQVWDAVKQAQLEELVNNLPNGLDTIIGERGTRLSGGQRQRVGIARALYHNPQVLVMDEATSALDNTTEKEIIKAIDRLKGDRTIIMIAHRLTTVENCDKIYFMQKGKIESCGSYNELLDKNSEFKKLAVG